MHHDFHCSRHLKLEVGGIATCYSCDRLYGRRPLPSRFEDGTPDCRSADCYHLYSAFGEISHFNTHEQVILVYSSCHSSPPLHPSPPLSNPVVLVNWMRWRGWSSPSEANGDHSGAGGKPCGCFRTMMWTTGGECALLRSPQFGLNVMQRYWIEGISSQTANIPES